MVRRKKEKDSFQSQRTPKRELDGSFRRNHVVVSKSQRELKSHQESVTQRQFDQKRERSKRLRRRRIRLAIIIIGLVLLGFQYRLGNTLINVPSGVSLPDDQRRIYADKITKLAADHTTFSQSWMLDDQSLNQQIIRQMPEIQAVSFDSKAPFSRDLIANITFRTPEFTWTDASKSRQFVDSQGILFDKNYVSGLSGGNLVHIEDQSGAVLDAGSSVLTRDLVSFVGRLPSQLKKEFGDKNLTVERVIIPQSIREVRFKIHGDPYEVRFDSTRGLEEQVSDLKLIKNRLKQQRITPRNYIDIRVENKAFYK